MSSWWAGSIAFVRLGKAVWSTGGCASWYLDDTGRNSTIWPDWTWRFRQRSARFDPAAYELSSSKAREKAAA